MSFAESKRGLQRAGEKNPKSPESFFRCRNATREKSKAKDKYKHETMKKHINGSAHHLRKGKG